MTTDVEFDIENDNEDSQEETVQSLSENTGPNPSRRGFFRPPVRRKA